MTASATPFLLGSNSLDALGGNNGRTVCKDNSGTYHLVWMDGGIIYYTTTDDFSVFTDRVTISEDSGSKWPTVAIIGGYPKVMWYQSGNVKLRQKTASSWGNIASLAANEEPPSIYGDGTRGIYAYVKTTGKVACQIYDDIATTYAWRAVPDIAESSGAHTPAVTLGDTYYHIFWQQSNRIKYNKFTFYELSQYPNWIQNQSGERVSSLTYDTSNPCAAAGADGKLHVSWNYYEDENPGGGVAHRYYSGSAWSGIDRLDFDGTIIGNNTEHLHSSVGAFSSGSEAVLVFDNGHEDPWNYDPEDDEEIYYKKTSSGVFPANPEGTYLFDGTQPHLTSGAASLKLIYRSEDGTPYTIEDRSTLFTKQSAVYAGGYHRSVEGIAVKDGKRLGKLIFSIEQPSAYALHETRALPFVEFAETGSASGNFATAASAALETDATLSVPYSVRFVPFEKTESAGSLMNLRLVDTATGQVLRTMSALSEAEYSEKDGSFTAAGELTYSLFGLDGKQLRLVPDTGTLEDVTWSQTFVLAGGGEMPKPAYSARETHPAYIPDRTELTGAYPNPFNPVTTIHFTLHRPSQVVMDVYNVLGQKVASLLDEERPAGVFQVQWDGRNETGTPVAGGMYLVRMTAGGTAQTKKVILLK